MSSCDKQIKQIKLQKLMKGLEIYQMLNAIYETAFITEIGGFGIYDVRNTENGHIYRVRVDTPLRLAFLSASGELTDQPRGKCPCPRDIQGCCQHIFMASFENAKRLKITVDHSLFACFQPSQKQRKRLKKAA